MGSPPHTRGKEGGGHPLHKLHGITPAHAGKRNSDIHAYLNGRDHPRTRGEKSLRLICVAGLTGITPAHAGKSWDNYDTVSTAWDHPRTRGEKEAQRAGVDC